MKKRGKMRKSSLPLHQQQAEQLAAIGTYLAEVRQQQALSLQEVASRTLVQARLLQAIEEGRLEALPEPVYIQGFIRRFAEALGLEGASLAQQFPTGDILRAEGRRFAWQGLPVAQLRPFHLYLLYIVVVVFAVNSLSSLVNPPIGQTGQTSSSTEAVPTSDRAASPQENRAASPQENRAASPQENRAASPQENRAASPQEDRAASPQEDRPTSTPPESPATVQSGVPKSDPGKPLRVRVTLVSPSWIRVVADGQTAFEGVLPPGANQQWAANQQLVVRAGDAGAVLLSFNDGKDERLGEPGAVEEVVFESEAQTASLPMHLRF